MDYNACSTEELRGFVESRMGVSRASRRGRPRATYITALRQLDRNMTFNRFMDLPPELRILVYRQVFASQGRGRTTILRSNKMVKKEAEDVLYGEGETFIIVFIGADGRIMLSTSMPERSAEYGYMRNSRDVSVPLKLYTALLAKFGRMRILMVLDSPQSEPRNEAALLQSSILSTFIEQSACRNVTVHPTKSLHDYATAAGHHALQPLINLKSRINMTFKDADTKQVLSLDSLTPLTDFPSRSANDTLAEWFKTIIELEKVVYSIADDERRLALQEKVEVIKGTVCNNKIAYDAKGEELVREVTELLKRVSTDEKKQVSD